MSELLEIKDVFTYRRFDNENRQYTTYKKNILEKWINGS